MINIAHQLGGSLGLGVLVAVFAAAGSSTLHSPELLAHRIAPALTVRAAMRALAVLVACTVRPRTTTGFPVGAPIDPSPHGATVAATEPAAGTPPRRSLVSTDR